MDDGEYGVRNNEGVVASETVYIYLYKSDLAMTCQGQSATGNIGGGSQVLVTMALTWIGGYNITHFLNGNVIVQKAIT